MWVESSFLAAIDNDGGPPHRYAQYNFAEMTHVLKFHIPN